jgi:hypothetical protein
MSPSPTEDRPNAMKDTHFVLTMYCNRLPVANSYRQGSSCHFNSHRQTGVCGDAHGLGHVPSSKPFPKAVYHSKGVDREMLALMMK